MVLKEYLNKETYLNVIKKSVGDSERGNEMFQSVYATDENGEKVDITEKGNKSCAFYVSFILAGFKLIDCFHTTVNSTVNDMLKNGWQEIKDKNNIEEGDVIVWDKDISKNIKHMHIGFYIGNEEAVSNISEERRIGIHHFTYNNKINIIKILRYNFDKKNNIAKQQ